MEITIWPFIIQSQLLTTLRKKPFENLKEKMLEKEKMLITFCDIFFQHYQQEDYDGPISLTWVLSSR